METKLVGIEKVRRAMAAIEAARERHKNAMAKEEDVKAFVADLAASHAQAADLQVRAERALALSGSALPDSPTAEEEEARLWARKARIAQHKLALAEEEVASALASLSDRQGAANEAWLAFGKENGEQLRLAFVEQSRVLRQIIADWYPLAVAFAGRPCPAFLLPAAIVDVVEPGTAIRVVDTRLHGGELPYWERYGGDFFRQFTEFQNEVSAAGVVIP